MIWKLLFFIPVLTFGALLSSIYYQAYQYSRKHEHLPKVLKVPERANSQIKISAYRGPHPSKMSRPSVTSQQLINLGEVGPVEALFAGPLQYPFLCNTEESGLGQPLIDNQDGIGIPIFSDTVNGDKSKKIIGYSKNCLLPTKAWYYYQSSEDNRFHKLEEAHGDIVQIRVNGKKIPFIVRLEMGTINRFIYSIAVLKGDDGQLDVPDGSNWNRKLIYQFKGGVGIGRKQGKNKPASILERRKEELLRGYAVIYSTANQTSNHYSIWRSEDSALRVKRQFNNLYGKEDYVVGVGGSGGAIQQYLIGQNNPSFLDAAIALYSYPDMVTQTIYALDCELLEYYFDITDYENEKWRSWKNRSLIEGMNASVGVQNKLSDFYDFTLLMKGYLPPTPRGMSECSKSWRGVTQLVNNPKYVHYYQRYSPKVLKNTHWSHWEDLKYFYGVDSNGYAQQTFDNVGVQYGLKALNDGHITIREFLKLNAEIGGWKQPSEMGPERYWKAGGDSSLSEVSIWSRHNMTGNGSAGLKFSARTKGSTEAMKGAYRSGHVFLGKINIPIIDLRHYLEDELDMHHTSASFATRLRMQKAQGYYHNQLIWMAKKPHNPLPDALDVIDEWLTELKKIKSENIKTALYLSRPNKAKDRCYSESGEIIAQGNNVWDGEWNGRMNGICMDIYPIYQVSRTIAGANLAGDTFKCALQSVTSAIKKGLYQGVDMEKYLAQMQLVFPDGVCDYTKQDVGKPE